jgi:anti-anti-sigma regulatory factor
MHTLASSTTTFDGPARFDIHRVPEFDRWIKHADGRDATIDLTVTAYVDQAAINAIRRAQTRWARRGLELRVDTSFAVDLILRLVDVANGVEKVDAPSTILRAVA